MTFHAIRALCGARHLPAVLFPQLSFTLTTLAVLVQTAAAQPVDGPLLTLPTTVVTASRTPQRVDDTVSDVVVIDRSGLEKSTGRTLSELLARVPGVQFSANGGLGKTSSVNIRGAEARHTLLLIDGVHFGSATTGTPNLDTIPVDMIERIEILKGPASAMYGSEAVGGVVQVFLRQGTPGLNAYSSATADSRGYGQVTAGINGGSGPLTYALSVQKTRESGFSATNAKALYGNFNPDNDGFDQNSVNASVSYQPGRAVYVTLNYRPKL